MQEHMPMRKNTRSSPQLNRTRHATFRLGGPQQNLIWPVSLITVRLRMTLLLVSDGRIRSFKLDQPEGQRHDDFRLDHGQLLSDAVPRPTLEGPPRGAGDGREAWGKGVI